MTPSPDRAVAGAIRWWMPLLALLAGTAALVFAAWAAGVDMHAAGERMLDHLDETFNHTSWSLHNEAGELEVEFDRHDNIRRVLHDGQLVAPEDVVIENNYITVTSLLYDDGELMYWALPMDWTDEQREEVKNPRWRLLMRVHPRGEDEPPGLRVARLSKEGLATRAGLQVGDVIVGVEDERPGTSSELEAALQLALAERAPGGLLALLIERGGTEQVVRVELTPLVSQAEWDATPGDDPVERWMLIQQPWRRDEQDRSVSAVQESPGEQAQPGASTEEH